VDAAPAEGARFAPPRLLSFLERIGVPAPTYEHEPVRTVVEAKAATAHVPASHCKNLFLRDRAGQRWLVVLPEERVLDLATLASLLDVRRLSFASPAELEERLGVLPGAVTPFAVVNDPLNRVRVVLDRTLLSRSGLKFHPLVNTATTVVSPEGLLRFLEAAGHPPTLVDLG
jgi:Ala-tRNA(Pro) deacylase